MKYAVVFVALFAIALAAPAEDSASATIVRQELDNIGTDGYKFAVETSDGKIHTEEGELKQIGENAGISVRGQFSFIGDDGVTYTITYVADENGFQPEGAHLPVAPEA